MSLDRRMRGPQSKDSASTILEGLLRGNVRNPQIARRKVRRPLDEFGGVEREGEKEEEEGEEEEEEEKDGDGDGDGDGESVLGGQKRRVVRCTVIGDRSVRNCSDARDERARNNRAKKQPAILNGRLRPREDSSRRAVIVGKQARKEGADDRPLGRPLVKSLSVPDNLPEAVRREVGILKRSSAFLASLTHPRKPAKLAQLGDGYVPAYARAYFTADERLLPSPTIWNKKRSGNAVKKSVSFSSDTSFAERCATVRRDAVHEVALYRKGVLQGRETREKVVEKVPPSWETPSGGPAALLGAARQADDALLKEIVARVRRMGLGNINVNTVDSSGRSAVSYMAGNGAATMLEAALAFEGVDPNLPDNEGNTALHFAAQAGQTECLNILLQRCPDIEVDARNSLGFTPLMKAALQGRTKCAKILLFAGANPTLRDHGRGLRAEQWARFCGRYVCAEVIERFARHRLLERTTSCRWGSEPELAAKILQGKVIPVPPTAAIPSSPSTGLRSRIRRVFRTTSGPDRSFSLVTQLTSAALCASSPALPKPGDVPPVVKSLLRPLSVPQLRVTLVAPHDVVEKTAEKIENAIAKPPRTKKKGK